MATILITGANRGIGLEFTRRYLGRNDRVIACCRSPEKADELQRLADPNLQIIALDVSDETSIAALPTVLAGETLSVFINNAGVYGQDQTLGLVGQQEWLRVLQVNTIAPLLVTRTILPFMGRQEPGKLVYLSSKMGSIADNAGGGTYIYRSSKTALNQVVRSLAVDLAPDSLVVAALHPGWVQTRMGGPNALIDTATSVSGMLGVIDSLEAADSGRFINFDGQEIPW